MLPTRFKAKGGTLSIPYENKLIEIVPRSMRTEHFSSHEERAWPAVSDHCGLVIEIEVKPHMEYEAPEATESTRMETDTRTEHEEGKK